MNAARFMDHALLGKSSQHRAQSSLIQYKRRFSRRALDERVDCVEPHWQLMPIELAHHFLARRLACKVGAVLL